MPSWTRLMSLRLMSPTAPVEEMGVRRVIARTEGGALPRLLLPFCLFAEGPMGNGKRWYSWIHLQGQRAVPQRLLNLGFEFRFPTVDATLEDLPG
jgi:NAD dependent epimerase/dehydratase family enzyme